jgi:uncharacterized membrane protein
MENNNQGKDSDANRFLAVVLISLIWAFVLTVSVLLAFLFDGGGGFISFFLLFPFSYGGVYASRSVWKHYQ